MKSEAATVREISARLRRRRQEIGRSMIDHYRREIRDYSVLDNEVLAVDVMGVSLDNLDAVLELAMTGTEVDEAGLDGFRLAAARRVDQGVALESLLHAYRLWSRLTWESVREVVDVDQAAEITAALDIAGHIMTHLNLVSTASARAYLDEMEGVWSEREALLRELLEEMLAGRGEGARVTGAALAMTVDLWDDYLVAVARRGPTVAAEPASYRFAASLRVNRRVLDAARAVLRPPRATILAGIRRDDVIALYPLVDNNALAAAHTHLNRFAVTAGKEGFAIGVAGPSHGRADISRCHHEAEEAANIAISGGRVGAPVAFDDVLIDFVLGSNPLSGRLAEVTLGPLAAYDREHGSNLVATVEAFIANGLSLTRTATTLAVHPNTVAYRLGRIRELTGRDLQQPQDLVAFTVALRVTQTPG